MNSKEQQRIHLLKKTATELIKPKPNPITIKTLMQELGIPMHLSPIEQMSLVLQEMNHFKMTVTKNKKEVRREASL